MSDPTLAHPAPVGLAVYTDAEHWGGAEASVASVLSDLADHVEATVIGVDADVVAKVAAARPGTATRLCRPVRNKADVAGIVDHLRAVLAVRPEILHVNLRTPWSCQYGLAAGILVPGVRVVAVEHMPPIPSSPFQRRVKRWTSAHLAAHVACSDAAARANEAAAGLRPGAIGTIYNGVAGPVEEPAPRSSGRVVGSVGRLVPEKGFDVLVAAVAGMPGATLRIVGDGPDRAGLEVLAAELGAADRVELLGWRDDVAGELAAFDVFAAPSRVEGFGMAAVEAMLSGVPVVACRTGGLVEVVGDGEAGVLVRPEDPTALAAALSALLDDPPKARELGRRGRARAQERFSPEAAAAAFEALYQRVLTR